MSSRNVAVIIVMTFFPDPQLQKQIYSNRTKVEHDKFCGAQASLTVTSPKVSQEIPRIIWIPSSLRRSILHFEDPPQ